MFSILFFLPSFLASTQRSTKNNIRMNASVAYRLARGPLRQRIYNTSLMGHVTRGKEKELFGWKQFRRLSESKPIKSKPPTPKHLSSKSNSKSKSIATATTTTALQRIFDYWNDAFATPGRDDASLVRYPSWKTPVGLGRLCRDPDFCAHGDH